MTWNGKKSRPAETDPYAYESGGCLEMVIQFFWSVFAFDSLRTRPRPKVLIMRGSASFFTPPAPRHRHQPRSDVMGVGWSWWGNGDPILRIWRCTVFWHNGIGLVSLVDQTDGNRGRSSLVCCRKWHAKGSEKWNEKLSQIWKGGGGDINDTLAV